MRSKGGNKKRGPKKVDDGHGAHRTPDAQGEHYAVVSKMLGGRNIRVVCADGKERLCVIRNKFRGRHKRSNVVGSGTLVLVGLYEWASSTATGPTCDMLHVYGREQTRTLSNQGSLPGHLSALAAAAGDAGAVEELDANLEFCGDAGAGSGDDGMLFSDAGSDCGEEDTATPVVAGVIVAGDEVDLEDI